MLRFIATCMIGMAGSVTLLPLVSEASVPPPTSTDFTCAASAACESAPEIHLVHREIIPPGDPADRSQFILESDAASYPRVTFRGFVRLPSLAGEHSQTKTFLPVHISCSGMPAQTFATEGDGSFEVDTVFPTALSYRRIRCVAVASGVVSNAIDIFP